MSVIASSRMGRVRVVIAMVASGRRSLGRFAGAARDDQPHVQGWAMDVSTGHFALVAGLLSATAPLTAFVIKLFEVKLSSQKQRHKIAQANAKQQHKITTEYLDRALKAETPLATRHALLRFLATKANDHGDRLTTWAKAELAVADVQVRPFEEKVNEALVAIQKAKDVPSLKAAEAMLQLAVGKRRLLDAPPAPIAPTPEAIRAGFFANAKGLEGLDMAGQFLAGAKLAYTTLTDAKFTGADLRGVSFQGADVRAADFSDADLRGARFYTADCRGANFANALLHHVDFEKARLEKADLEALNLTER
jgi:hypothetical protein